jgi:hypothetical protein
MQWYLPAAKTLGKSDNDRNHSLLNWQIGVLISIIKNCTTLIKAMARWLVLKSRRYDFRRSKGSRIVLLLAFTGWDSSTKNPVSSITRNGVPIISPNFPHTLGVQSKGYLLLYSSTFIGTSIA